MVIKVIDQQTCTRQLQLAAIMNTHISVSGMGKRGAVVWINFRVYDLIHVNILNNWIQHRRKPAVENCCSFLQFANNRNIYTSKCYGQKMSKMKPYLYPNMHPKMIPYFLIALRPWILLHIWYSENDSLFLYIIFSNCMV